MILEMLKWQFSTVALSSYLAALPTEVRLSPEVEKQNTEGLVFPLPFCIISQVCEHVRFCVNGLSVRMCDALPICLGLRACVYFIYPDIGFCILLSSHCRFWVKIYYLSYISVQMSIKCFCGNLRAVLLQSLPFDGPGQPVARFSSTLVKVQISGSPVGIVLSACEDSNCQGNISLCSKTYIPLKLDWITQCTLKIRQKIERHLRLGWKQRKI